MTVGRFCRRSVFTISGDATIEEAARRMEERNVGTLVVLTKEKEPVGLITDRDIAIRVVARHKAPNETSVLEAMTGLPRKVHEEMPLEEALAIMRSGRFRRLPIVSEHGLVGILALDDVLRLLCREMTGIGGLLLGQRPEVAAVR